MLDALICIKLRISYQYISENLKCNEEIYKLSDLWSNKLNTWKVHL